MKFGIKKLKNRLRNIKSPYRFQIIDTMTYDVRWSIVLSKLKLIIYSLSSVFLIFIISYLIIAFTPLKKTLPIFNSNAEAKREVINLELKTRELEEEIRQYSQYYDNIIRVFNDSIGHHEDYKKVDSSSIERPSIFPKASQLEAKYRDEFEALLQKDRNFEKGHDIYILNQMHLPVEGKSVPVKSDEIHLKTLKIEADADAGLYAVLDGVVIAKYISGTKTHLYLQHNNNIISIYKFEGTADVIQGEPVVRGQFIGAIGEKGDHILYFDLWMDTENIAVGQFFNF